MPDDVDFQKRMQKIERLVHEIESHADPRLRSTAAELVSLLMELHGAGLTRIMERVKQASPAIATELSEDPLVGNLLLLYGLHPEPLEARVGRALDKVRPFLAGHGGSVELLKVEEGRVRLRLLGNCHGCPSSAQTLKHAIEEAIYEFAADVVDLQVDGVVEETPPAPSGGFVPLNQLV